MGTIIRIHPRIAALACSALLLTACIGEKTPQEVSEAFWESVIENDKEGAVRYSTLTDVHQYDGFSHDWHGLDADWGRVVIDGDEASVVTNLSSSDESRIVPTEFNTILVREGKEWKVDYARTEDSIRGPLGGLFGRLDRWGKELSRQLQTTSSETAVEVDRLGKQINRLSESAGERASQTIDEFGETLRQSIDELARSAEQALQYRGSDFSDEDQDTLRGVIADLNRDSERLSNPTARSVAESSTNVTDVRERLDTIDREAAGAYKAQWRKWGEQIEQDLQEMIAALSAKQVVQK